MEFGSIEREIRIDAAPDVVFQVVSDPVHVRQWWPDEAEYEAVAGNAGEIAFMQDGKRIPVAIEVVEATPNRMFSFRWGHPQGDEPSPDNSLLVTFELEPAGSGTLLRMTESGFREQGWEVAALEETYRDHESGWDYHLARLAPYVATVGASTRR